MSLYHDSTSENTFYHCWRDNATSFSEIIECPGISMFNRYQINSTIIVHVHVHVAHLLLSIGYILS